MFCGTCRLAFGLLLPGLSLTCLGSIWHGYQMAETMLFGSPRLSGVLLLAGLVLGIGAAVIMIASGALPAFSALLRGSLAEMAPHVLVFRIGNVFWAAAWVAMLLGFVLFTRRFFGSDGELLAILSLAATAVAAVLALLEASFGFTVTAWAIDEAARSGAVPATYSIVNRWVNGMQGIYLFLGFAAQAGFGAALLRTELLPSWVGMTSLIWGLGWLTVLGLGIPAILFILPALIGTALLVT